MRNRIGASALFWCSPNGHAISDGWWKAMSGAPSLSFNVLLCHGPDPDVLTRSIDIVAAANVPSTIMLAGPALAGAQTLCDAGWVCVGTTSMMALRDIVAAGFEIDPCARQASLRDLGQIRDVVRRTFNFDDSAANLAIPATLLDRPDHGLWTLAIDGEIRSTMVAVVVEGSLVCWSMATLPSWQGHGYGRRLLSSVLARYASTGVTTSLLYASSAGEPLYRSLGYQTMEHWQLWSRPRWAFGVG
jgi:GNAT superfamily N-acetyltransferase